MSYVIDINKLEKGDVVLRRWPNQRVSQIVMEKTNSNYSHALLCVDYSSVIDASNIVRAVNPLRDSFDNNDDALVLRLKPQFRSSLIIENAIKYARSTIGTAYSMSEAKELLDNPTDAKEPNRQICTRLVAKAYESAGLKIVDNPDYPSIKDLEDSSFFEVVHNCEMKVTPQIQEIINSKTIIDDQTRIIEDLLKKCRELYAEEDIQTFEQLFMADMKYPARNTKLAKLVRESGYLDLWKKEETINPENFNVELFIEKHGSNSEVAAHQPLEANEQCLNRYKTELLKIFPLMHQGNDVLDDFGELYINLVNQCGRRGKICKEAINNLNKIHDK